MKVQRYEVISKWTNLEIWKWENEVRAAQAVVARRVINFGKVCTPKSDLDSK